MELIKFDIKPNALVAFQNLVCLACFCLYVLWAPAAFAQGTRVGDLPEKTKAAAGFTLDGKKLIPVNTPWGTRNVYDPSQDGKALEAFESLFNFARQDDYFQSRPSKLYERSERDLERAKVLSGREDIKYLSVAKHESLKSLQNAGCSFVATRNCTELSVVLSPPKTCRFQNQKRYPFLTEMIGDPMRGAGELITQFDMFFETSCNVWADKEREDESE